jgi:hypothetical protein
VRSVAFRFNPFRSPPVWHSLPGFIRLARHVGRRATDMSDPVRTIDLLPLPATACRPAGRRESRNYRAIPGFRFGTGG